MSLTKIGKTTALSNALSGLLHNRNSLKDVNTALLSFGGANDAASALAKVSIGKGLSDATLTTMLQSAYGGTESAANAAAEQMRIALTATSSAAPEAEAAISGVSGAFITAKTTAIGLFSVIKSLLPVLTPIAAIFGGKFLFDQLDDAFTLTKKMADKHYQNSVKEYDDTKSEVDSMNSEYETNKNRIYELNTKENPTLAEQNELVSLQNQNNILSQRKTAKESMLEIQQKKKIQDTATSLQHKAGSKLDYDSPAGPEEIDVDEIDIANDNLNELEDYYARRNKLIKENSELASNGKADSKKFKNNEKDIKKLDKWIDSTQNDVTEKIDSINKKSKNLYNTDGSIDDQYKDLESRIKKLNNRYSGITNTDAQTENAIKNILARSEFDGLEEKLLQAGKSGGRDSIKKILTENKELSDSLNNVGIESNDFISQIMAQANPTAKRLEGIKENLKDIFGDLKDENGNSLYDFFNDKTGKEIENFWDYYTENGLDAKFDAKNPWDFATTKSNFDKAQKAAKDSGLLSTTFSSLFKNSTEDTSTDIDTITDNFQTDMTNIKSAMDSIKTGTFKNSDVTDLIQQFPELATETDDLQKGLQNLTFDKASKAINKIKESVKDVTDPKELAAADKYVQSIMDTIDLSGMSISDMKNRISSNLVSNASDQIGRLIAPTTYSNLMDKYGNDEYAVQAILKLSMDPSFVNDSFEDQVSKIEKTKIQCHIDVDTKNLENLSNSLIRLQTEATQLETDMNNKSVYNQKITESDYDNLIKNGNSQISNLRVQIRENKDLQTTVAAGSEQYKQYQDQIDTAQNSITNMQASQAGWEKDKLNLPVTDITTLSSTITNALSEIQTSTGLTTETMDSLKTEFSDLTDSNINNLFKRTANGVQLNTDTLQDYLSEQNKFVNSKFENKIKDQRQAVADYRKELKEGKAGKTQEGLQNEIDDLNNLLDVRSQYNSQYAEILKNIQTTASDKSLENMSQELTRLQTSASDIQTRMSNKATLNQKITASDYQDLIKNGDSQIENLQKQIQRYQGKIDDLKNTKGLSFLSDEELSDMKSWEDSIQSAQSSIESMRTSQVEWAKEAFNLPVTDITNLSSAISTAFSEIQTSTGLTSDTMDNLRTQFSDLADSDVDNLFQRTADGLQLNTKRMKGYLDEQNKFMTSKFSNQIDKQRQSVQSYREALESGAKGYTASGLQAELDTLDALLNRRSQYYAQYENASKQFTDFQNMVNSESEATAGDEYTKAMSYLKTGKDLLDKKLVGTPQFKAIAKYFSQNGFEDYENFQENYTRLSGYYTEGTAGPLKFLNDLKSKGLATYKSLEDGNYEWQMTFGDTESAADQMGMSLESFESILGRLEDYGFTNPLVNSLEEGALKTDEISDKLIEAQTTLAKMKANGASQSAIDDQESLIADLKSQSQEIDEAVNDYVAGTSSRKVKSLKEAKSVIDDLSSYMKENNIDKDSDLGRKYIEQIQDYAKKNHIKLTPEFKVDEASYNEMLQKEEASAKATKIAHYKSLYSDVKSGKTVENGDFDSSDEDSVNLINKIIEARKDKNQSLKDALALLRKQDASDLEQIELGDGDYEFDDQGLKDAEDALQNLATEFGLTKEQANMLLPVLQALGLVKVSPEVDAAEVDSASEEIQASVEKGMSALRQMKDSGEIDLSFSVDADTSGLTVEELDSQIEELESAKHKVEITCGVDSDEYQALEAMISEREIQKHVQILMDQNPDVDKWLNLSDEDLALQAGIDLNDEDAQSKIDALKEKLQSLSGDSGALTVQIDETQFNTLTKSLKTDDVDLTVNVNDGQLKALKSTIDSLTSKPHNVDVRASVPEGTDKITALSDAILRVHPKAVGVRADVSGTPDVKDLSEAISKVKDNKVSVGATTYGTSAVERLADAIASVKDKSVTVTSTTNNITNNITKSVKLYTGTALAPARANGTMHNAPWNMPSLSSAFANGKIGLSEDQEALVNELGTESVIRGDQWFLLPGGMHTEKLKKGDIVLNHKQTADLIKGGKAFGHARAYANGTLDDLGVIGAAYATGHASGNFAGNSKNPSSTYIRNDSTNGNSKATDNNTAATNDNTSAVEDATKTQEELEKEASEALDNAIKTLNDNSIDWLEILADNLERVTTHFKDAADSFNGRKGTDEALKGAMEALQKEIDQRKTAYDAYIAYSERVAQDEQVSKYLTPELKQKVQDGDVDIGLLNENEKKAVDAYKEWWDKAVEANEDILDKQKELKELAQQRTSNVTDKYDVYIGKRTNAADLYKSKSDLNVNRYESQKVGSDYYKNLEQQRYNTQKATKFTKKEIKLYQEQMKNYLKTPGAKRTDIEYQEMEQTLIELKKNFVDLTNETVELTHSLHDVKEQTLQWKTDRWDRASSKQQAAISWREAQDDPRYNKNSVLRGAYSELIKTTNKEIIALNNQIKDLYDDVARNKGVVSNELIQEKLDKAAQMEQQVLQLGTNIEQWKNKIMDLRWEPFYDQQDQLDNVVNEYQNMQKLLGDTESFYNDDGSFTKNGLTNLLLLQESIDATKDKIANYRVALDKLDEQYKNGCYSQEEYTEKSNELLKGLQEASTAMSEYRQSMLDMYETQITKENDLLQENIDKRLEALDAKEKYYDYDKTLKKKSKDINALKAQIAALEGTTLLSFFI